MDIETIFRHVMNRGGEWTQGDGAGGAEVKRPPRRPMPRISKLLVALAVVIIIALLSLDTVVTFWTDLLWFRSLGFESVMWRRIVPEYALLAVVGLVAFVFCAFNWRLAARVGNAEYRLAAHDETAVLVRPAIPVLGAAVLALFMGLSSMSSWEVVLQYLNGVPFGKADPIFGIDAGFYVFTLPFLKMLKQFAFSLMLLTTVGTVGIYLLCRALRNEGGRITLVRRASVHIAMLASLCVAALGAMIWISRYELLYSPSGIVFGMGYTDLYVKLPAMTVIAVAAFAAAGLLLLNLFKNMWKLSAAIVVVLVAGGMLAQSFLPSIVQNYIVQPNEYELEKEFIAHHIDATRRAYDISDVEIRPFTPEREVTADEMRESEHTVSNIRLWDYAPLLRTYKQLQEIRTYYDFRDIDIDRYEIDGKVRQVMLAVRELDLDSLQNRTWVNSHLEFTHGYGVVMNPVNEVEGSGMPVFFMKDLPPRSTVPIKIDRPEIYYGERTTDYALVRTKVREFDYPAGDSNARSTYAGTGGVAIGSLLRRLLFAMRFRDSEIIFTDSLTDDSVVLFNRQIRRAISEVAPFLMLDDDAYPVILDGRILWVQDAYTATDMYPYSLPLFGAAAARAGLSAYTGANYIRNSVKITVDAYDGTMRFYAVDESDPILRCWMSIFPDLFTESAEIPSELRDHFRYPEEFFEVQSEIYRTYHMTDTNTFYNREDVWMTTPPGSDRRIRPNYVTMQLADESAPEFMMITPFMPMGRNNLIGWMAARCDGDRYGQLIVYQFPKQELTYGPPQIEALIDQNTTISSQLSLWSQHGSDVVRGDLLVIPIGRSLLYVEPLYLRAERGDLPELKRIILSTGGRLAWGETFEEAAAALFGGNVVPTDDSRPRREETTPTTAYTGDDIGALARQAREHYDAATEASRRGDWSTYGEELKRLEQTLRSLEQTADR